MVQKNLSCKFITTAIRDFSSKGYPNSSNNSCLIAELIWHMSQLNYYGTHLIAELLWYISYS